MLPFKVESPSVTISVAMSLNRKAEMDNDSFSLFTLPTRLVSIMFGLGPIALTEIGFRFSPLRFCYCAILILSTSLARIYLTPPEPRSGFFYQVLYYKQILMPATCILSFFIILLKLKQFLKYFEQTMALRKYVSYIQRKRFFYLQILLIFVAIASLISANVLMYLLDPSAFHIIPRLLDIHLSMTLWVIKLQFYVGMIYLWSLLLYVRRSIADLPKVGSPFVVNQPPIDFNSIEVLFDQILYLAANLNECYEVVLGVASILTSLNCITTAYFHLMTVDDASGPYLLVWLVIDFGQEWMFLSGAVIFMNEVRKIPIVVHESMRRLQNRVLIKQLKHFSIYLIHRQVKFNICGMVPLDYSLLFTIAGAVTTYMIVLVQFQKTENSLCLKNSTSIQ